MADPSLTCRVLPLASANGVANMAMDHALLDSVDADPSSAVLRFYLWAEPTLSLGYFQSLNEARDDPRWEGLPIVRRPSGGGALLHDQELTYALIVPRSHPLAHRPSALYRAVHSSLAVALSSGATVATRRGDSDRGPSPPFLCFLDHDSEDILVRGSKVVGSAQRRRPNAVLQHGSILLARSVYAPELPGLQDLTGECMEASALAQDLAGSLCRALGMSPEVGLWRDTERISALEFERSTYGCLAWTGRR